jgi:hypothetical protein
MGGHVKNHLEAGHWRLMPVILANWEADIGILWLEASWGKHFVKSHFQNNLEYGSSGRVPILQA